MHSTFSPDTDWWQIQMLMLYRDAVTDTNPLSSIIR